MQEINTLPTALKVKFVNDDSYRSELLANPKAVLNEEGYEPSEALLSSLQAADADKVADAVERAKEKEDPASC